MRVLGGKLSAWVATLSLMLAAGDVVDAATTARGGAGTQPFGDEISREGNGIFPVYGEKALRGHDSAVADNSRSTNVVDLLELGKEDDEGTATRTGSAAMSERIQAHGGLAAMPMDERADLLADIGEFVVANLDEIANMDFTAYPELDKVAQKSMKTTSWAIKSIADISYLFNQAKKEEDHQALSPTDSYSSSSRLESSATTTSSTSSELMEPVDVHRLLRLLREKDGQHDQQTDEERKHHGDSTQDDEEGGRYSNRRRSTEGRGGSTNGHEHTGPHHFRSHRHAQMHKLHEAIYNGDHRYVKKLMASFEHHMYSSAHGFDPSGADQGRRRTAPADEKQMLCEQLWSCTSNMSLYDIFVYYFSDVRLLLLLL